MGSITCGDIRDKRKSLGKMILISVYLGELGRVLPYYEQTRMCTQQQTAKRKTKQFCNKIFLFFFLAPTLREIRLNPSRRQILLPHYQGQVHP
jgi:hypothetical protein